ncbi:hypothetical protein SAMN05444682_114145 [Parapedobacter indicus]|uniref:Uncharacterized protein n=2 Tax=Parapedobacter indicus TaxID=1477437 RepID=A0A1I3UJQ5_9SPHI|nr:hypothetical protein CLV26_114145 [Parapedobacter indicus]SFJ82031.1 hypothetical protein SAMN05444682_114145 [Parapedobacter indicus]
MDAHKQPRSVSETSVPVALRNQSAPKTTTENNKEMKENQETVGLPEAGKPTIYERIKEGLAVASQLVIASPLKLPPKLVVVAKYLALALGVLEAVEGAAKDRREGDED